MRLNRLIISIIVAAVVLSALPSSAMSFPPIVKSCDVNGTSKEEFVAGESVYITVTGLIPTMNYSAYIQEHPDGGWMSWDELNATKDPSTDQENINFTMDTPIMIWSGIPSVEEKKYDIVVDLCYTGFTGTYTQYFDGLDSDGVGIGTGGFLAPVPELPTITLTAIGLIGLIALGRRR